jgi:hypothetical protein
MGFATLEVLSLGCSRVYLLIATGGRTLGAMNCAPTDNRMDEETCASINMSYSRGVFVGTVDEIVGWWIGGCGMKEEYQRYQKYLFDGIIKA